MITMADQWIKCATCKTRTNVADFTVKKDKRNKSCKSCCARSNAYHQSLKCEHGKRKDRCIDCGGVGICEHRREKSKCMDCGGGSMCEHKRQKSKCIDCGGASICEHKRQRAGCKQCTNPQKVMIEHWMRNSKKSDIHRKQETNITREFCAKIIAESQNKCCYCAVELQMLEYSANLMTIERIDNRIGHVVGNCRVACFHCNCAKAGDKIYRTSLPIGMWGSFF